jgi:hypothetical protein
LSQKVTTRKSSRRKYANGHPSPAWPGTGWANTEFRTYKFTESVDDDDLYGRKIEGDNASILETVESRKRRDKYGEPPPRELQKQFFVQAMTGWENQVLSIMENEAAKRTLEVTVDDEKVAPEEVEVTGVTV